MPRQPAPSSSQTTPRVRRGFTLVELTLAIVVGSLVLLGVAGVFAATRNMDRIFGDQYNNATQLHITQMTIRRSLLTLQIKEDQRQTGADSEAVNTSDTDPVDDRSRIILESDPVFFNTELEWEPQRFEIVVSTPPIALNMATKAAAWARINDRDEDSLDFSSEDASGGVLRSVFELRPNGVRERVMREVGIMDPDPQADLSIANESTYPFGWTLWWRPILRTESNFLRNGGSPLTDTAGTPDEIRFRLAGAIPLIKDIDVCNWTVYKGDTKITDYNALSMSELPAYAEFELLLTNGQYANWMFEIDWMLGEDPLDLVEDDNDGISGTNSGSGSDPGSNGGDSDSGSNPDEPRPGGGVRPPRPSNNNGNLGGRQQ